MMQGNKKLNLLFIISVIGFLVMSADFLLMPLGSSAGNNRGMVMVTGLLFWLGLAVGIVFFVLYARQCKRLYDAKDSSQQDQQKKRIGLISFFSNRMAMIADIVFFVSAVAFAALMIFTDGTAYINYIVLFILVLSFIAHCVFNGKSFYRHQLLKADK